MLVRVYVRVLTTIGKTHLEMLPCILQEIHLSPKEPASRLEGALNVSGDAINYCPQRETPDKCFLLGQCKALLEFLKIFFNFCVVCRTPRICPPAFTQPSGFSSVFLIV